MLEALDQQFDRQVAVKQLEGDLDEPHWKRFVEEALVTGSLDHPGIPTVYERGIDDEGVPFYAMRKVKGRTLTDAIRAAASLEERLALLPFVIRVAQTLAYAHERGIVHRDVKPLHLACALGAMDRAQWATCHALVGRASAMLGALVR